MLVQIENEYGAYGDDKDYLAELVRVTRETGITVPLTTIDQPTPEMLDDGSLPGLHMTGSFGSRSVERLATLREYQPTGPLMCMEFWDGWFDRLGHRTTTPRRAAAVRSRARRAARRRRLGQHLHVPRRHELRPHERRERQGPLPADRDVVRLRRPARRERASHREVLRVPRRDREVRARSRRGAGGIRSRPGLRRAARAHRLAARGRPTTARRATGAHDLPTFDELGHDRGLALFRTRLEGDGGAGILSSSEVRDRAWLFLDGVPVGVLSRDAHERVLALPANRGELTVLVEDQGRVDYGTRIGEEKGLIGGAQLDGVRAHRLDGVTTLDLDRVPGVATAGLRRGPPAACGTPDLPRPLPALSSRTRASRSTSRPTSSSTRATGARASRGSTASRSAGTGAADRSRRCTCPGPRTRDGAQRARRARARGDRRPGAGSSRPELGHTEI